MRSCCSALDTTRPLDCLATDCWRCCDIPTNWIASAVNLLDVEAVIIGGGSLAGGRGTVLGTLLGATTMTVIQIGCAQKGYPNWLQQVVTGAIDYAYDMPPSAQADLPPDVQTFAVPIIGMYHLNFNLEKAAGGPLGRGHPTTR